MSVYACQMVIPAASGLPEDALTNTFHFESTAPNFPNLDDILFDFYDTAPSGGTSLASNMPSVRVGDQFTLKVYNLDDSKPRAPVSEETRTVTLSPSACLPSEVALVMSFQGSKQSGLPQARRRNRIYIGPVKESDNNNGRPSTAFVDNVTEVGRDMIIASNNSASWTWVAYSPTAQTFTPVVDGWVDNAFDTQRRRGLAPISRDVFDASTP